MQAITDLAIHSVTQDLKIGILCACIISLLKHKHLHSFRQKVLLLSRGYR